MDKLVNLTTRMARTYGAIIKYYGSNLPDEARDALNALEVLIEYLNKELAKGFKDDE